MKRPFYFLCLFAAFIPKLSLADIPAPLGVEWGKTDSEVIKLYSAELVDDTSDRSKMYILKNTPIKIDDFNESYAGVDDKYGLYKVVIFSNIKNDAFGSQGKKIFEKYNSILKEKYGKPTEEHTLIGKKLYSKNDEFYQCLAYQGCGYYFSYFEPASGGVIMIRLEGLSRGKGSLSIVYQSSLANKIDVDVTEKNDSKIKNGL